MRKYLSSFFVVVYTFIDRTFVSISQEDFEYSVCNSMTAEIDDEFYNLYEKIEDCKNSFCCKERNELKAKCIEHEEKLNEINQAVETLLKITRKPEEKEKTIDKSKLKVKKAKKFSKPLACSSKSSDAQIMFSAFGDVFLPDELLKLRTIGTDKKDDSSFILNVMRFLYRNDSEKLSSLSLTGRSRGGTKKKLSSLKYNLVKNLFWERLSSLNLYSDEFSDRAKRMNKHIKSAILNTARSMEKKMH